MPKAKARLAKLQTGEPCKRDFRICTGPVYMRLVIIRMSGKIGNGKYKVQNILKRPKYNETPKKRKLDPGVSVLDAD